MRFQQLLFASAASLALVLGAAGEASAQAKYPARTIEVVVPFAPGGGTDNMMRMITGIMERTNGRRSRSTSTTAPAAAAPSATAT
jgi:tripartite-type tricarboxylate transporter receptor subunit TctC